MTAFCITLPVVAQWAWIDHDGRKVFSDRSPPLDIPEKNILKRQGAARTPTDSPATGIAQPAPPQPTASKPVGFDAKLADRKAKAEQAEAAKRLAEDAKLAQAKAETCTRAKQAQANLQSGVRISRLNLQGEPEILDDAARSSELVRIRNIMAADCR